MPAGAQCAGRPSLDCCHDTPGLGSGLTRARVVGGLPTACGSTPGTITIIGTTDRGCNQDCGDVASLAAIGARLSADPAYAHAIVESEVGYGYPQPSFAPAFVQLSIDLASGRAIVDKTCYLKNTKGLPVTGVSTEQGVDDSRAAYCPYSRLHPSVHGALDVEDLHQIPGTKYCLVTEEYSPSVIIINCDMGAKKTAPSALCGRVLMRYLPIGHGLTAAECGYPVKEILPRNFMWRRPNNGLENAAVSQDGKTAFVFLQSALGEDGSTEESQTIMAAKLDITNPLDAKLEAAYLLLGENRNGPNYVTLPRASSVKFSGSHWVDTTVLAGAARPNLTLAIERVTGQVMISMLNFDVATNILPIISVPGQELIFDRYTSFDAFTASLSHFEAPPRSGVFHNITPVRKDIMFNTGRLGGTSNTFDSRGMTLSQKIEGVVPLSDCTMIISNDNDFGYQTNDLSNLYVIQLPANHCFNATIQRITA